MCDNYCQLNLINDGSVALNCKCIPGHKNSLERSERADWLVGSLCYSGATLYLLLSLLWTYRQQSERSEYEALKGVGALSLHNKSGEYDRHLEFEFL